jgi:hypothetical protein
MLDKCVFKLLRDFAVEEIFSYESLKSRKRRIFLPTSYIQGQVRESQGSRWAHQGWSIATRRGCEKVKKRNWSIATKRGREKVKKRKRKEKHQGRREGGSSEGKVQCALHQEFLFFGSQVIGLRSGPSWLKYWLLRD